MKPIPEEIIKFFEKEGNNILLVKGDPGAGKTIFSLECLVNLAEKGCGYYFSTRVNPKKLLKQYPHIKDVVPQENIIDATASHLSFSKDVKQIITFSTIPEFLRELYFKLSSKNETQKLFIVVDSVDGVCETLNVERTRFMRAFYELISELDVNAIVITENSDKTILDYMVDGVVKLKQKHLGNRIFRTMIIEKLRGIEIKTSISPFTLANGRFTYIKRLTPITLENITPHLKHISKILENRGESSLNYIVQRFMGINLRLGDFVLCQIEPSIPKMLILQVSLQTLISFVKSGFCSLQIPPGHVYSDNLPEFYSSILKSDIDKINILLLNKNSQNNFKEKLVENLEKICNSEKSCIHFAVSALESTFDTEEVKSLENLIIKKGKKSKSIILATCYDDAKTLNYLKKQADIILRLFYKHGCIFSYGEYPATPIFTRVKLGDQIFLTEVL